MDMEICCGDAADVVGPSVAVGAGGTGDLVVITGTADDAI